MSEHPPSSATDQTSDDVSRRGSRPQGPRLTLLALISALSVVVVTATTPQGLFTDPAWELRAVQQATAGESPTINTIVEALPADLSRDDPSWITWWAPGTALLAWPMMRSGIRAGTAVRVLAAVCLIFGSVGWARWLTHFALPKQIAVIATVALPWMHYASTPLFTFSAEAFVYAWIPWALVSALALARQLQGGACSTRSALVAGLLLGSAYLLKYSMLLATIGAVGYLAAVGLTAAIGSRAPRLLRMWAGAEAGGASEIRSASLSVRAMARCAVVLLGSFAAPVLTLAIVNRRNGSSANLVTASAGFYPDWRYLGFAIGNPALAIADADGFLRYLLLHPSRAIMQESQLMYFGLPFGLLLLWLVFDRTIRHNAANLARFVFVSSVSAMLYIWTFSSGVSMEARHLAAAGLTVFPLVLQAGVGAWRSKGPFHRALLAIAGSLFIALPLLYGAAAVWGKVVRTRGYRAGASAVYNPLLAATDVPACRSEITKRFDAAHDVLYVTNPITPLDIDGRAVIEGADFIAPEILRAFKYRSSTPIRVVALLPTTFDSNGKAAIILGSFSQVSRWTRIDNPHCVVASWIGDLTP